MSYATQDDIDLRYPGALEQAGPRDAESELDEDAIDAALVYTDAILEERLSHRYPLPWTAPYPAWLVDLAVDLALYRATPAVVVDTFSDRKTRHDAALSRLDAYAAGRLNPPSDLVSSDGAGTATAWFSSNEPRFVRGSLF